jgi:hypothetical protein
MKSEQNKLNIKFINIFNQVSVKITKWYFIFNKNILEIESFKSVTFRIMQKLL